MREEKWEEIQVNRKFEIEVAGDFPVMVKSRISKGDKNDDYLF